MGNMADLEGRSGKASSGNDSKVKTRIIINGFYTGKGELGRKRAFSKHQEKCRAATVEGKGRSRRLIPQGGAWTHPAAMSRQ